MLAIKLIILTGAKYSVIRKLKYYDLNTKVNTLKINGYTIRLPINLSNQFQIYDEIRQSTLDKPSDFLFCSQNGDQWKGTSPNSNIVDFLSVVILRQDTTGITKFGISNLLKAGISIAEIEKLTEAKSDIIRGCMSSDIESEENKMNKYINMRLSSIDYFYRL